MINANFPRLRRRALEILSKESAKAIPAPAPVISGYADTEKFDGYAEPAEAREILRLNIAALSNPETRSFLCPEDGRMIDRRTPCLLSLEKWQLPFRGIAIEYANTVGYRDRRAPQNNFFPDATILLVNTHEQSNGENLLVANSLWFTRGICIPASVSFVMTDRTSIEVLSSGEVLMRDFSIFAANGGRISDEDRQRWARDLADEMSVLAHFVLLCNCDNVSPVKVFTPSPALVKRTKERGRIPPDEYYVLDCFLGEHTERNEDRGGSHASPRFHVRRGHIRRLPDGRRTWVKQCTVGDVSNGRVDKDYLVKIRNTETVRSP